MSAHKQNDNQDSNLPLSFGFYNGNRYAHYRNLRIMSAFQPIYSIAHRRIVGLEGLARGIDENANSVAPAQLFTAKDLEEIIHLDYLCQRVHLENFYALNPPNAWLFLNIDPHSLSQPDRHIEFLSQLVKQGGYKENQIVIEILESMIDDEAELEACIERYKSLGFLIAIDDFGAGHSNFERIWRIKPDIVKLDRSMLQKAGIDPSVRSLIKGVTNMLHNCKCIVLAEGVETEDEAIAAMEGGVDLVQGFYFARPFLLSESIPPQYGLWKNLYQNFDHLSRLANARYKEILSTYVDRFQGVVTGEKNNLHDMAKVMLKLDKTIRLFQLSLDGEQCFSNINSETLHIPTKDRLRALADAQGASWKRREYFNNAINNPGIIQTTKPYFSISDGTLCITLSVQIEIDQIQYVVCCDVLWEETSR